MFIPRREGLRSHDFRLSEARKLPCREGGGGKAVDRLDEAGGASNVHVREINCEDRVVISAPVPWTLNRIGKKIRRIGNATHLNRHSVSKLQRSLDDRQPPKQGQAFLGITSA